MKDTQNISKEIHRINGQLYQTIIIKDSKGDEVQRFNIPLKVELKIHDILEIIVGASVLAVPVAFTEEVWNMGDQLPWFNTIMLSVISIVFIGAFIYYTAYRQKLKLYRKEYIKRILSTFILSVIIMGILLTVVDKCPWFSDFDLALKRTLIGAFPASLSATVTDNIT